MQFNIAFFKIAHKYSSLSEHVATGNLFSMTLLTLAIVTTTVSLEQDILQE